MTAAKNIPKKDKDANRDADAGDQKKSEGGGAKPAESVTGTDKNTAAKPASTGKRPLGTKEVIPFAWKLVGASQGMVLTLFKSVELADVEAQYERVKREGYYTDLRILDINEKVKQPKPPKPVPASTGRRKEKLAKSAKRETAKGPQVKQTKKARPAAARAAPKKKTGKATVKAAKKKKATSTKSAKKKAKKRS